jgi:hypothetical protein
MTSERHIHVAFFNSRRQPIRRTRHYKSLDTAAKRAVQLMILEGKVGQVGEIYHVLTGLQFGTVKMTLKGQIIVDYNDMRIA